ncbi:MAG: 3-hydroxyisobutyrate dehydrogenase [Eggerthellaceae bacterium]|nr:3-hydroxyisobutyrate dehydrogenase [Eggerthellaceae bacterium]
MEKETMDYVAERVAILSESGASTQVTKDAALAWQQAVAEGGEAVADEATEQLLDVLEGRPTTIDGVIAFAEGPAKEVFGEEAAAQILAAQRQRKEQGAKWCDCDACTAATEVLAKFGRVEL